LQADLALALLLDVQQGLRDDLKLLIMSATLDNGRLQQLLPDAPMIISEGRTFPSSDGISRWRHICVLTKRWR
jgi:ATP-dependent helicase HrpB